MRLIIRNVVPGGCDPAPAVRPSLRIVYRVGMTWRKTLKAALNITLILLISFALGEVVLRLFHKISPSYVFYNTNYDRFRAKPGSNYYGFPINSQGFHDVEIPDRDPETYRIVALGDSFAFGVVPYEFNYLTLLESALNRPDRPVEVINMGIPRTAPMDYLALLVAEGLPLEPNRVLVSFYIGNDFIETHRALNKGRRVHQRSYVLALLRFAVFIRPEIDGGEVHNRRTYRDDDPTFSTKSHLQILADRAKIYVVGWEPGPRALDAVLEAMQEIAEICTRRGIDLTVVLIPEETQLDTGLQRDLAAAYKQYREGTMDYRLPNRVLTEGLNERGIEVLDLLPFFEEASESTVLYKPRDTHWNIAGNRLAADVIASHLDGAID